MIIAVLIVPLSSYTNDFCDFTYDPKLYAGLIGLIIRWTRRSVTNSHALRFNSIR